MIQGGRVWTRTGGLMIVSLILIACVFIVSGGLGYFSKLVSGSSGNETPTDNPQNVESSTTPKTGPSTDEKAQ